MRAVLHMRSGASEIPWPPPTHVVTSAYRPPVLRKHLAAAGGDSRRLRPHRLNPRVRQKIEESPHTRDHVATGRHESRDGRRILVVLTLEERYEAAVG